jgi:hypothetical protein
MRLDRVVELADRAYSQGEYYMQRKLLYVIVLCLFAELTSGFMPVAAFAQDGTNQNPQLLIKIRNIDQLLDNIEKMIQPPTAQGSPAISPIAMLRGMIQGTAWIDPQRCIAACQVSKDAKSKLVVLVPFRTANTSFQMISSAIAGENYYLLSFPPEPGFSVDPAIKASLIKASATLPDSSLVVEVSVGLFMDQIESQMTAAMKTLENFPQTQTGLSAITPQESLEMLTGIIKTMKQAETIRYGLDISGDIFTLQFDVNALPNTPLAGVLVDSGGNSRLMNYQSDLPIQFRSRAHKMGDMLKLMNSSVGEFYRKIGIDFDKMGETVEYFAGESAGGMKISSDGFAIEAISVLRPGTNGGSFITNTYLPFIQNYSLQMSNLAAKQTGKPAIPLYEQTADSMVAGIKVIGFKANSNSLAMPDKQQATILGKLAFEIRIAAVDDMILVASDDARLADLIQRSRGLKESAAQGPMMRFDLDLDSLIKGIQSLLPPSKTPVVLPDNLGKVTVNAEINNGKMATSVSFNIASLQKLFDALKAQALKQALPQAGVNARQPAIR